MSSKLQLKIVFLGMLLVLARGILHAETTNTSGLCRDPISYVLDKCKSHDVVLLGTRHKQPALLDLISRLLLKLGDAGVSYLGLEIASDQQPIIDRYIKEGTGLDEISLHYALDCPGTRNVLGIARNLSIENGVKVNALDLPPSFYQKNFNRDEWMARSICTIFDENPNAKALVIVGNLHTLKTIRWKHYIPHRHGFIPSYLYRLKPALRMSSICQCIKHAPLICDFCKNLGGKGKPAAIDCDDSFSGWKLGILEKVATESMKPHEVVDGVIVH